MGLLSHARFNLGVMQGEEVNTGSVPDAGAVPYANPTLIQQRRGITECRGKEPNF